jgi:hypothetical protein
MELSNHANLLSALTAPINFDAILPVADDWLQEPLLAN